MLTAGLHALSRHDPQSPLEVDFRPLRINALRYPRGRQDDEFQRPGSHSATLAQLTHEWPDIGVGQGLVVLYLGHLGTLRQQLVQVPAPASGILADAMAADGRPTEYGLDASAHPTCCLGLARPEGF